MMRQIVMTFGNADVGKGTVAAVVREQHRRHAGGVRLKRQHHDVVHELDVLRVIGGNAGGRGHHRIFHVAELLGLLDARLQFANAGQILVQLVLVARIEPAFHGAGVLHHEIQNGTLFLPAALRIGHAFAGRARAEQPFKNLARIGLGVIGVVGEFQERLY